MQIALDRLAAHVLHEQDLHGGWTHCTMKVTTPSAPAGPSRAVFKASTTTVDHAELTIQKYKIPLMMQRCPSSMP